MKRMAAHEAQKAFSTVVDEAEFSKRGIILTRRGKDVAAIVPMEVLEDLSDMMIIQKRLKAPRFEPWEKVKKDLGLIKSRQKKQRKH